MQTQQDIGREASILLENAWRFDLKSFAAKISSGGKFGDKWLPYRHLEYAVELIMPLIEAGGARIIITLPPRHGKSETFSKYLSAYMIDGDPTIQVMLASYEAKFAAKWGRKVRDIFEGSEHTISTVRQDMHANNEWEMPEGGGMVTAGAGGSFTGKGADLAICDDPHKNSKEAGSPVYQAAIIDWWDTTFMTRLEPGASVVLIMTRWHENDLGGHLLRTQPDDWTVVNLPALAEPGDPLGRDEGEALCPERYDREALLEIKRKMGSRKFNALYQQRPSPAAGAIYLREWIKYWDELPARFDLIAQSWDLAFKGTDHSDYVVGQVWGTHGADRYLLDQFRARVGFTATGKAIEAMVAKWPEAKAVYVEDKANGPAIMDKLKKKISGLIAIEPEGGKVARANATEPEYEAGQVYFPPPDKAPWVEELVAEMLAFPNGAHDDQVDAMTQALIKLGRERKQEIGLPRTIPIANRFSR